MTTASTSAPRRRVAIIGAGPGGIAAALTFHRARHEMRLFERQDTVRLRDLVFDHTRFLEAMLVENHLKDAEMQTETLPVAVR